MYTCAKLDIHVWRISKTFVGTALYNLYLFHCLWKVCCHSDPLKDLLPESVIRVLLVCLYHDGGFFATNCTFPKFIYHLHTPPLHLFWRFAIKHLKKVCCRVSIVWFHTIHCSCLSLLKTINFIHNAVLFEVKIKNASKTSCI